MGWLWGVVTVVGPLLLIAAIIWVTLRQRNIKRSVSERSEQGAREVRADIERDDKVN
jgi:hypothetical protein